MSKSRILRQHRTVPFLGQYSISCDGKSSRIITRRGLFNGGLIVALVEIFSDLVTNQTKKVQDLKIIHGPPFFVKKVRELLRREDHRGIYFSFAGIPPTSKRTTSWFRKESNKEQRIERKGKESKAIRRSSPVSFEEKEIPRGGS